MTDAPPKHFPDRWRLSRAGIVNVWHYLENTFDLSGGRMILRGTNGSGKSRALEMLLPFLLDADRRKMDATGSGRVNLDELMRVGAEDQANRTGYLWLELQGGGGGYLTVGALVRHGRSATSTQVWYFATPLRVGYDLALLTDQREPLSRDALGELIGAQSLTDSPEAHRERVRTTVFGLHGDSGRDRYVGLLQLLHTLRSPDVGNRIDEGRLPQILSDSLPPLEEQTLNRAGEQLDGLTALRHSQQRLEESLGHVTTFLAVYRRYAATAVLDTAAETLATVNDLAAAERAAATVSAQVERLRQQKSAKEAELEQRQAEVDELQNAINGIRARDIFSTADDLVQRDRLVETLARATDNALAEASRERDNHARAVIDANDRVDELRASVDFAAVTIGRARNSLRATGLGDSGLPGQLRLAAQPATPQHAVVRVAREPDPQAVLRPAATQVALVPPDLQAVEPGVQAAADAAAKRRELAERRLQEAKRLTAAEAHVRRSESEAATAQAHAERDVEQAESDAQRRDDHAVSLANAWRAWTAHESTTGLLGSIDWTVDEQVGPLLLDAEALCGAVDDDLDALDRTAARRARLALDAIATARAGLERERGEDDWRTAELRNEAAALRREEDPAPAEAPWLSAARPGVPLWRAVDFVDGLPAADRAGIEAALLASGLLTASVEADGSLRADDGHTLLSPAAGSGGRPLTAVLRPDPASPLDAALVARVLGAIGFGDDSPTAVFADGSWRHGPLRGRLTADAARHIGAAARAANRRERLAAIAADLAELDARAADRRTRFATLDERSNSIDAHVSAAPLSAALHQARGISRTAEQRAERSAAVAREATERAREVRVTWARELAVHTDTCQLHGLPTTADALAAVVEATREASADCRALVDALRQVAARLVSHERGLTRAGEQAARRDEAESRADEQWRRWHEHAAEVAALHQAIDLTVEEARRELERSENALVAARATAGRVQREVNELGPALGTAEAEAKHAAESAEQRRAGMVAAADRFSRRVTLPGLVRAASDDAQLAAIVRPDIAESVRDAANSALAAIAQPAQPADENHVLTAFQRFDRDVSGQLDVSHTVDGGIALVTVLGAGDDHTLAGAAAVLAQRVDAGRSALSEREREVFTTFVLGGVAEELRRRINQASRLVDAMNLSLRTIRTSNGIGVRLHWHLADDAPALKRIADLVRTADAVRSPAQNAELTELLRQRVDESYAADPSSGYAAHLGNALDYRRWHAVGVTILGPNPHQERRLSTRAKLSQGETRFVSYVTLFAAADGYLSGLSTTDRQLRLILLDDAFAKVDDPTIADLMGLLVRLDLDFVMTGHALWGCFPQVPNLDVYEVRRQEGTSAVTTHVHWDGHTRHLRSTA